MEHKSEISVIEVEHELEKPVHFVFLNNPCLAERAHYLQERLPFFDLVLFDCDVRHLYYHYVVAQIGLIVAHLCLIELNPSLLYFIRWYLLFLL